jgi:hypothetical protein
MHGLHVRMLNGTWHPMPATACVAMDWSTQACLSPALAAGPLHCRGQAHRGACACALPAQRVPRAQGVHTGRCAPSDVMVWSMAHLKPLGATAAAATSCGIWG